MGSERNGQRFSNVVSVLALVIVVATGGAYAASKLQRNTVGAKQVKNGSLTGRDVKDDSLTGRDVNESSLNLPAGPPGAPGAPGARGATGPAGPLLDTLPSGRTLRGAWYAGAENENGTGFVADSISFPYPLASAPDEVIRGINAPPSTNCPGSLAQPEARAGEFCLYTAVKSNVSTVQVCDPVLINCGTASRFGVGVNVEPSGTNVYYASGTWAVTAP